MKRLLIAILTLCAVSAPAVAGDGPSLKPNWTTTQSLWDSGTYEYDGAGNIRKIGADTYRYDGAGRLTFATAGTESSTATPDDQQSFSYDRYGNITSITVKTKQQTLTEGFAVNAATNQLGLTCTAGSDVCFT